MKNLKKLKLSELVENEIMSKQEMKKLKGGETEPGFPCICYGECKSEGGGATERRHWRTGVRFD